MTISTYAELKAAAGNWLVRGDLAERIPEFITLAEARLNRVLRARLAESERALTASIGSRSLPLPAGFAEPLGLWLVRDVARQALPFRPPGLLGVTSLWGPPGGWTIDADKLAFDRPCDQAYELVLRMLAKFQLSEAQPTNALLADYPDAYLFATLCEAAPLLRDPELAATYEERLARALGEINAKEARSRAPGPLATDLPRSRGSFAIVGGL